MIYIESDQLNPYFNLALEEYVFEKMDRTKEYFMLWQNRNTIVVGKYQNTAEEINQTYVDENGIRVARRLSGGGAVYHDRGNLNFTFIVGTESNTEFNFDVFVQPVVKALERFGVHAEFNGRNDITIDGKKFSGNSQYMRHKRILHHGCIMLDSDLQTVSSALKVKEAKFESKSVKSVKSRVTTINACAPEPITMEAFKAALRECAFESNELEAYTLTQEDLAQIEKLQKEKYETWEWIYGSSPAYNMEFEKKFPGGLVTVRMQVEHQVIKGIKLYGDFFGNGEIRELEQAMEGLTLDRNLAQKLEKLKVGYYINGMTGADLAGMLY